MPEFRRPLSPGEAVYHAVTGLSPKSEGRTTMQRTRDAVSRLMKSGQARTEADAKKTLAALTGASLRTVQRWFTGQQEAKNTARAKNADALQQAQRTTRIKDGRAGLLRSAGAVDGQPGSLKIYGTTAISEDERDRWVNLTKVPEDKLDALVDVLVNEGPGAAGEALNKIISQYYVRGMSIDHVEEIRYE